MSMDGDETDDVMEGEDTLEVEATEGSGTADAVEGAATTQGGETGAGLEAAGLWGGGTGNGAGMEVSVARGGGAGRAMEAVSEQSRASARGLETTAIEPGRLYGQRHNQILTVLPKDAEVQETAIELRGRVGEFAAKHGGRGLDVDGIKVEAWDARPELGSYADRTVTVANLTEQVNIATISHELLHGASFTSEYVEELGDGRGYVVRDICGLDTITSVYTEKGELVSQARTGEMVNEGLTVSYSRSFLEGQGMGLARNTEETLSYEMAADVADSLRASFPEATDAAYFQGQLEGLRSAFDEAAGRSGAFDEVSALLDKASNENLSLDERTGYYDQVQEAMAKACK